MKTSATNRPQTCGTATLFCREAMISYLRHRFPESIGYNVEALTGTSAATVDNWLSRRSNPTTEHFMRMLVVFGPCFLHAVLRAKPDWLIEADRITRLATIEKQMQSLQEERSAIEEQGRCDQELKLTG